MQPASDKLWVIHIGNNDRIAKRAQEENFICLGWTRMGDLTPLDTREKAKAAFRRTWPDTAEAKARAQYGQPYRFAHRMKIGDLVVYPIKGSRNLLIGRVVGPYEWAAADIDLKQNDYCNIRRVQWLKEVPRISFSAAALHSFGSLASLSSSDEFIEEVMALLNGEVTVAEIPSERAPSNISVAEEEEELNEAANLAAQASQETEDYLLRSWSRTAQDFEAVVAAVFEAMGYTVRLQQGTHDLGVDVIAHPDPLGVQPPLMKIQAKSGTSTVGAPAVKQLRGLLNDREKGILVALGGFSNDARHVQQNDADLVLIDGERFVELFLQFYDRLDPEWRNRFPLKRVYVPLKNL